MVFSTNRDQQTRVGMTKYFSINNVVFVLLLGTFITAVWILWDAASTPSLNRSQILADSKDSVGAMVLDKGGCRIDDHTKIPANELRIIIEDWSEWSGILTVCDTTSGNRIYIAYNRHQKPR